MYRFSMVVALFIYSALFTQASGDTPSDKAKTIPLEKIWAYEMPGTKDVRHLEHKVGVHDPGFREFWEHSLVRQIVSFLSSSTPEEGKKAGPAFVVVGIGKDALKAAHEVLMDKKKNKTRPSQPLPKDKELSLVFYHYVTGWHPRINSVEQSLNTIVVKYQFVTPPEPSFGAARFAIIPIGKLPPGVVRVKFEQVPPVDFKGRPSMQRPDTERLVSDSFSFDVQ
jgi:hypothetical protein